VSLPSIAIRLLACGALLLLAVYDVWRRRLPTPLVLAFGGLFFLDALLTQMPTALLFRHLLLTLLALMICIALFAANMIGGGDAKLATMIFLWTGPSLALLALTLISLAGACVALISLATRHMHPAQGSTPRRVLAMFSGARGVPYGVALMLAGSGVLVLPAALQLCMTH
jgi:prepilin peptidase CpaA